VGRARGRARRARLTGVRVRILAAGTRLPRWVNEGYAEYAARMPRLSRLELIEIPLGRGSAATRSEGARMLERLTDSTHAVALAVDGSAHSTQDLARWWGKRLASGRELAFLIGGPDGLSRECLSRADECLSLSALTLPHGLARVVLAEQLYRVTTLLAGHPYHRA
jgi:23S rRNA (pseudouridine1915-N3)-methyltransferase